MDLTFTITLTEQQRQNAINLLNVAVKAIGLDAAAEALELALLLQAASPDKPQSGGLKKAK